MGEKNTEQQEKKQGPHRSTRSMQSPEVMTDLADFAVACLAANLQSIDSRRPNSEGAITVSSRLALLLQRPRYATVTHSH